MCVNILARRQDEVQQVTSRDEENSRVQRTASSTQHAQPPDSDSWSRPRPGVIDDVFEFDDSSGLVLMLVAVEVSLA